MNGVLVIDKPADYTSFDVVAVLRGLCKQKKIGHTGTLDPMATGVLPMLLGSATRAQALVPDTDKEYHAGFQLGISTDTQDSTGKLLLERPFSVTRERLEAALAPFRGEIRQVPPMYSAVQKNGVRLYDLARKGIEVEREARPVTIYRLELAAFDPDSGMGELLVRCSKGTYIRTLCADLGETLGCGAVMCSLRRTAACGFTLDDSITLDEARQLAAQGELLQRLRSIEQVFLHYPVVKVTAAQANRFRNGGALLLGRTGVPKSAQDGVLFRVRDPQAGFLGLGRVDLQKEELRVHRLFCEGAE